MVWTLAYTPASALTLGRMHGGVLLGHELDLTVQVQFVPEEDVSAACFVADVAYGETPVPRSRITVLSQAGTQPQTQVLRVRSSARVDEAVVSVNLTAVCAPNASRRYVMLSDVLSESLSGAAQPAAAVHSAAAVGKELSQPPMVAIAQSARTSVAVAKRPAPKAVSPKAKVLAAPKAVTATEHDGAVKALKQAQAAALEDLQRRVDAISKWQDQSHTADDLLKIEARQKALESELKALHLLSAKNQQSIQTLSAALDKAESGNYPSFLIYGLGALLAGCLASLAFVLIRLRRSGGDALPWWSEFDKVGRGETQPLQEAPSSRVEALSPGLAKPVASAGAMVAAAPVARAEEVEAVSESFWPQVAPVPAEPVRASVAEPAAAAVSASVPTGHASLRAISTKEMLDVRQQAEFFMALGQHDDAVQLLETSIQSSAEANPLVYLDLLKIFHTLSRRSEFEQVRTEFNQQFTGRIPEYSSFLLEGNGLEAYDDICQQIVVLWPTEYTVDFIEQCLVRTAEDDPEQGIDLQAFKDLLLLYGVLKRLDQTPDSQIVPFSASRAAPSPSAPQHTSVASEAPTAASFPVLTGAPAPSEKPVADLDIDLDLDLDLNFDLDLDLGAEPDKKVPSDNLIDFDMSGYNLSKAPRDAKK